MSRYDSMDLSIPPDDWRPAMASFQTTKGNFKMRMYWKKAPLSCRNFSVLVREGFYDGLKFHRVLKKFIIQAGDHKGTGNGWLSIYGNKFEDEFSSRLKHDGPGVVGMANSGPNTNGSQFFITMNAPLKELVWLDRVHTIFGRVTEGLETIYKIGNVPIDGEEPLDKTTIIKAELIMTNPNPTDGESELSSEEEELGEEEETEDEDEA